MRRCFQQTTRTVLSSRGNNNPTTIASSSDTVRPGSFQCQYQHQHQHQYQHQHQHQHQHQQYRWKSTVHATTSTHTNKAKAMLGFRHDCTPTVIQLREAYYEAAKKCHPDVVKNKKKEEALADFRALKDAYEYLLNGGHVTKENTSDISIEEEEEYRRACMEMLGLKAEIVEECKQDPKFLQWLSGRTDAAQYWTNFFRHHGGLGQKIRPPAGLLEPNINHVPKASESRRRRGPARRR